MGICSYKKKFNNLPDSVIEVIIPKYNELNQNPIIIPKYKELNQNPIIIPKYNELNQNPIIIPKYKELNQNPIIIPKYKELNQSPPFCFNKHCIKECQSPTIGNIKKHCISKQGQSFDEYYYNKYMNSPNN
jgi:hypothetical protein